MRGIGKMKGFILVIFENILDGFGMNV